MTVKRNWMAVITAILFVAMLLMGCTSHESVESHADDSVVVQTASDKEQKNGFDKESNVTEVIGNYSFSIPEYWKADITETGYYRAYAETSEKVAMLQITSEYDKEDKVTFELLKQEDENGLMAKAITTWFDSCGEIQSETYDNGSVKGYHYTCTLTQNGYDGKAQIFIFPSVSDNCWIYVTLVETDNTEYSYFNDFSKIIESISDAQTTRLNTIEEYPKSATYKCRDQRDTLHLTIDFEHKELSGYNSTANTRSPMYYQDFEGEYPNNLTAISKSSSGDMVDRVIEFTGPEMDPSRTVKETLTYSSGHTFVHKYERQSIEW